MFPREVVEKILAYCDGYTLLNVYDVNSVWRGALEYVSRKTNIWEHCCIKDIPGKELIDYLERYNDYEGNDNKWLHIYQNWFSWMDIKRNIKFEIIRIPMEITRITCIALLNGYIAIGSEDGRVRVFNRNMEAIYVNRTRSARVTDISLMCDEENMHNELVHPSLAIGYNRTVVVAECDYNACNRTDEITVHDVMLFSVYKTYIGFVKVGGRICICEYARRAHEPTRTLVEITYARIYSPVEITSVHMWEDEFMLIMKDCVKVLDYNDGIAPMSYTIRHICSLNFTTRLNGAMQEPCTILREDVVISMDCHVMELFILSTAQKVSKLQFKVFECLQAEITCMFLYGNTFLIGVNTGIVYIYDILSWKFFNIRKHRARLIVGRHPIISFAVHETKGERNFFAASSYSIHKLVGYTTLPKLASLY